MAALLGMRLLCACSKIIWHVMEERASDMCSMRTRMKAMAAVETTRPAPFGAITTYRAIHALSNAVSMVAAWNDARITRKVLSKLSDRELDDIGLCRGDIEFIGR
jgi:uncharacterized protein YjiS (DUF1127 family)